MRSLAMEQSLKHRRFVLATWGGIAVLVAILYAAETSMVMAQVDHVLGLPGMGPSQTIESLAVELAVLTPGRAADHGLALVLATILGTALVATLGARLGASEYRWNTAAGFAVRHQRHRAALAALATALAILLSWALVAVGAAWLSATVACGVLGGHLPGFDRYVWAEPAANVPLQVLGAVAARSLDLTIAFAVAAVTRSVLWALVVPLGASIAQLSIAGEAAPGSWLPAVQQVSVWAELLRYSDGGLLYAPIGTNGAPLALSLGATVLRAAALAGLHHVVTTHRELRA